MRRSTRYLIAAVAGVVAKNVLFLVVGVILRIALGPAFTLTVGAGVLVALVTSVGAFVLAIALNDALRERYRPAPPLVARPLRELPGD